MHTDGSKIDGRVGAGIHSTCLTINKAISLPDCCSVFQAEICAIYEAINWLERQSVADVCILPGLASHYEISPHLPHIS